MLNDSAMNETFQAILDSLHPKEGRSKLEPYGELIHELRKRGRSYRDIASILAEHCGVSVGTHTVYNFVRVRVSKMGQTRQAGTRRTSQSSVAPVTDTTAPPDSNDEVWRRIQALKQRITPGTEMEKKEFKFDENKPLQLISDPQKKK